MSAAPVQVSRYDQADVVSTIKATVCKGATDAQLRMFLEVCRSTGLDPFLKEIFFVAEKSIIMASRDGYLRVANAHPHFDGMETRVDRDEKNVPIRATCSVWRKDRSHAITCEAYYSEYRKSSPVWQQYPSAMISKVAEVLALKRSFAINGVVTEEEIGYEERGSQAAADAVAQRKLEALRKPQPVAAIVESIPELEDEPPAPEEQEPEEEPSELEQELHDSIIQAEALRAPKVQRSPSRIEMLRAFATIKARYEAIGFSKTYYSVLALYGCRLANEFTETEESMAMARCCYKEMSIDVANREVKVWQSKGPRR